MKGKLYLKILAGEVPPETMVYKESPDPRSRKRCKPYRLTNKISFYSDDKREVVQYANKMLYLIDENGKISFIAKDKYVSVQFDSREDLKKFLEK